MILGIPKEENDPRVAIVPATIPKFKKLGMEILVEKNAGHAASFADSDYQDCKIVSQEELFAKADIIVSVNPFCEATLKKIKPGTFLISRFEPYNNPDIVDILKGLKLKAFSLDMIPRTTLAQSMDVLSSYASMAGYKAVLMAANNLQRYFPMMMTAAGTIKPSKVLVLGAGVAGLQAIATARKLGAMVEAFDVRAAAKEEVESLGAKFIVVEGAVDDKTAGGYAVQQSEEYIKKQQAEVQLRASKSDVIITTAQLRGRKAPILVSEDTVSKMKSGSVIIDLAASTGGNCPLSKNEERQVTENGIVIIGHSDLAKTMAQDASTLYSNNLHNFIKHISKEGNFEMNMEDEITAGAYITKD